MKIRQGNDLDLKEAVKIALAAWEGIYEGYKEQIGEELFSRFYSNWKENKSKNICNSLESDDCILFVTEKEGEVAAFITIMINEKKKTGIIGNNAVHPRFQGLGIGAMQYKYVLQFMKNRGVLYVKVTTGGDDAHIPARKSYEKVGFAKKMQSVTYFMKID